MRNVFYVNEKEFTVEKYNELPWNFDYLSGVKSITWDIVCKNKDKDWNFYIMDDNPSVTYQIFLDTNYFNRYLHGKKGNC